MREPMGVKEWDGTCAGMWEATAVLNVREMPEIGGRLLGAWADGERLWVWCRSGQWYLCQAENFRNGWTGWSRADWLTPVETPRGLAAPAQVLRSAAWDAVRAWRVRGWL